MLYSNRVAVLLFGVTNCFPFTASVSVTQEGAGQGRGRAGAWARLRVPRGSASAGLASGHCRAAPGNVNLGLALSGPPHAPASWPTADGRGGLPSDPRP